MAESPRKTPDPEVADEPGWEERFQRGLERALSTPPKPHKPTGRKGKKSATPKSRAGRET